MKTCRAPFGPGLKIQSTRQLWPTVNSSVSRLPVPCQSFVSAQGLIGSDGADCATRACGPLKLPVTLLRLAPATLSSTAHANTPMSTTTSCVLPFSAPHKRASADHPDIIDPVMIELSARGRVAAVGRPVLRGGTPEPGVGTAGASVGPAESSVDPPE